ncbi:MAG TPA: threonine/serine exporter family protein, partial [Nakamurella sp.]|nr:threonine/serine exporter family protein [Nakamurella sp.]
GLTILSLGFGLLLNPDALALPAYVALGAFVGLLRLVADRWATLSVALPVLAAFLVTVLSVVLVGPVTHENALRLLAPPLVVFLPGATLTIATIELASDQIVSGASRLVWGVSQLLLLAFGVFAGLSVVGISQDGEVQQLGGWAPWVGVVLVGIGYMFFSSAPPGALVFLWIALAGSYAAQTAGALLIGASLSGFAGGLVIVPLTQLLSRFRRSPPAAVMLLPAFWLLVPGALGLRGISQLAAGLGATDVVATAISLFAVALGVLVGTSVTRDVQAVGRTWRLGLRR